MQLRSYLAILWRRKWVIIMIAILTVLVATLGTLMLAPRYVAEATLRIATGTGLTGETVRSNDLLYVDRLMNTYDKIATSRPILQQLAQKIGRSTPPEVSVSPLANTELLLISVTDSDPEAAAKAANAMAEILVAEGKEFYTSSGKTAQAILGEQLAEMEQELNQARIDYENSAVQPVNDPQQVVETGRLRRVLDLREESYAQMLEQYERTRANEAVRENTISLIEPAVAPDRPSSPNLALNLGLALLLGVVGGLGLAFLSESLDTTLYTPQKIQKATQLAILGLIPGGKRRRRKASMFFKSNSQQEEAFRRLRTTLFALDADDSIKTLLVTSAEPNEGKSTIVANLALVVAQTGRKVIAVDSDMRRPTLHHIFGISNDVGLSAVLEHQASLAEAVQNSNIPGVQVLTSGPRPSNPTELLSTPQMQNTLDQLSREFDMVLLDTPALLAAADAGVLASAADGVIQVVGCAQSQEEAVRNARQQLATFKAKLIGVVVNRSSANQLYYYHDQTETRPLQQPG